MADLNHQSWYIVKDKRVVKYEHNAYRQLVKFHTFEDKLRGSMSPNGQKAFLKQSNLLSENYEDIWAYIGERLPYPTVATPA